MFCSKCGTQASEGAVFCQKCGTKIITDEAALSISSTSEVNGTNSSNEKIIGSVGNAIVGNGFAVYSSDLDLTYYVKKERSGSKIIAESKGAKREINIDENNAPKYLFVDKDNLYFLLQEGSKLFKKNPMFIYACPHGSSTFNKFGSIEAEQMVCHGEYIYYVTHMTKSHIFRVKKDGSGNETFVAKKAWNDISVYNDKLYFRAVDNKNQLMCIGLDGQNEQNVGTIKPNEYFISNGVIYYPDLSLKSALANKLNYYNIVDGSAGVSSELGGTVLNVVDGCAFTYPLNTEKLQQHPLTRYDIKSNIAIKYESIPAVNNSTLDRPTVNVANRMVYFGNRFGVHGRIPIDGGNYESL